jgi:hypothetical protein
MRGRLSRLIVSQMPATGSLAFFGLLAVPFRAVLRSEVAGALLFMHLRLGWRQTSLERERHSRWRGAPIFRPESRFTALRCQLHWQDNAC